MSGRKKQHHQTWLEKLESTNQAIPFSDNFKSTLISLQQNVEIYSRKVNMSQMARDWQDTLKRSVRKEDKSEIDGMSEIRRVVYDRLSYENLQQLEIQRPNLTTHSRQKSAALPTRKRTVQISTKLQHKNGYIQLEKEDRALISKVLFDKSKTRMTK